MNILILILAATILAVIALAVGVKALGGNLSIVGDWRDTLRYYSTWGLSVLAASPMIWNEAVASGVISAAQVPGEFKWMTIALSVYVFFVTRVKQIDRPEKPKFG